MSFILTEEYDKIRPTPIFINKDAINCIVPYSDYGGHDGMTMVTLDCGKTISIPMTFNRFIGQYFTLEERVESGQVSWT